MRRLGLFGRILLWFFATVLIVTGVTAGMIWYIQEEAFQRRISSSLALLRRDGGALLAGRSVASLAADASPATRTTRLGSPAADSLTVGLPGDNREVPFAGSTPAALDRLPPRVPIWVFDAGGRLVHQPSFPRFPEKGPPPPGNDHGGPHGFSGGFPGFMPEPPPDGRGAKIPFDRGHGPPPDRGWGRGALDTAQMASVSPLFLAGGEPFRLVEVDEEDFLVARLENASGTACAGFLPLRRMPLRFVYRFFLDPAIAFRLLILIGVAALLCWILARSLVNPVLELQRLSRSIAAGDLQTRLPEMLTQRSDELGGLAQDFNRMAVTINDAMKGQRQLLRDVSHELRSPLARIQIALELVRKTTPEAPADLLGKIEHDLDRLNALIQQVLDLSRLEQIRAIPLSLTSIDLGALVREVAADVQFEAELTGKSIRCALPGSPVLVAGAAEFLRRAVENVLRNAIRFTPDGGTVEVTLFTEAGTPPLASCRPGEHRQTPSPASLSGTPSPRGVLRTRDHGPGVPEEHLAHLFEPFFRCEEDRGRKTGGTGLGLAIVRRAIEAHDGTVLVRNHPEGGLEVEIRLPQLTVS